MSTNPASLKFRLLVSHLQVAILAIILLVACLIVISLIQRSSKKIADIRLPASLAAGKVVRGIEVSNSLLRSWVLLGSDEYIQKRRDIWQNQIEPASVELSQLIDGKDAALLTLLSTKMNKLKASQWWVEEIALTVGNNPARLIYEQDLLPIFHQLQLTLPGLGNFDLESKNISNLRILTSETHQSLSEAVRQLSEVVRTGGAMEINDFEKGAHSVESMFEQLALALKDEDAQSLLKWIRREYSVYQNLAGRTIRIRKSKDWNRALYLLDTETEVLGGEVKRLLSKLQNENDQLLLSEVSRNEMISNVGRYLTIGMIILLGVAAWLIAGRHSRMVVSPILALTKASNALVMKEDEPIQLPIEGPKEIANLIERFNYMSHELVTRSNELNYANKELHEYTHIISHDLKPPLINIKGHVGLIMNSIQQLNDAAQNGSSTGSELRALIARLLTEDIAESTHFINSSISKTSTLINGVFDNSNALFRTLSIEEVDMDKLVEQTLEQFSHRVADLEIILTHMPKIDTDTFMMEHVFTNLIDNALKYLDGSRPGRIEIGGELLGDEAHFYIKDNGLGLVESPNTDIYKLFEQSDSSNPGNGLGLALVATMLARFGGKIWHQNNAEAGIIFRFCVPLIAK